MNNKAKKGVFLLMLTAITASRVFAQAPTLDKLRFTYQSASGGYYNVLPANNQISGELVIPATYDDGINGNHRVNTSTSPAFMNQPGITSVIILGNNMDKIGGQMFQNCTGLTSITIPASVTSIGVTAFIGCTNLTSVTFLGRVEVISTSNAGRGFPGDLREKHLAGGPGTYTRQRGGEVWTKQGGVEVCPTCGQPLPR